MMAALLSTPVAAQDIAFGDDASEWANDDECDDRRFVGPGMATSLDVDDVLHDASDCARLARLGRIALWNADRAKAATQCDAIEWGDDRSDWANDGICDDIRFDGPGAADILLSEDAGRDATDCRALCEDGAILLRDY